MAQMQLTVPLKCCGLSARHMFYAFYSEAISRFVKYVIIKSNNYLV